eukprot:CAMPEP_0198223790 /NCGR_PEP_ID=MMETSP1445-20131203/93989_1 /TAXON_ID=36898 /ORGANISM="Pyramimonas sp., Strain CCMP2087" /LENGTH=95 /DNA_ID=CAMNT_0043902739 /DNA_START=39 /DNA_END=322 /DNA_ORIENTATION=-
MGLVGSDDNMEAIEAASVIPLLVQLLFSGTYEDHANAKHALQFLVDRAAVVEEAIPLFVEQLCSGSDECKSKAASVLQRFTFENNANNAAVVAAG